MRSTRTQLVKAADIRVGDELETSTGIRRVVSVAISQSFGGQRITIAVSDPAARSGVAGLNLPSDFACRIMHRGEGL